MSDRSIIYKVCRATEWEAAQAAGAYSGSPDDQRDGFIHFSNASQLPGTLARHFHGQQNLVLIAFRSFDLVTALRWEASRGGDYFPHYYGTLDPALAASVQPLTLSPDGTPEVPAAIADSTRS